MQTEHNQDQSNQNPQKMPDDNSDDQQNKNTLEKEDGQNETPNKEEKE